jgi:SAM-dependent methyltransferase
MSMGSGGARVSPAGTGAGSSWKRWLRSTWLFPRRIGSIYADLGVRRAVHLMAGSLIDVGCGQRPHERILVAQGVRYLGLDCAFRPGRNVPDVVGDAMRLPFLAGTVDNVLATEVIEHLAAPAAFVAEAARVLRPGGWLLLSAPLMEPVHEEPHDYFRFTAYGLRVLLDAQGFEVKDLWRKGGWWSVVLGSFVNQAIFNWINPEGPSGKRRNHPLLLAFALPLVAAVQWLGYTLDRLVPSSKFTLGYFVLARLRTQ